jgi:myb proto-oncogene protein
MNLPRKSKFSPSEDRLLLKIIEAHGTNNWCEIKNSFPGRTKRQLRERYKFYLDPKKSRDDWTKEEDQKLLQGHEQFGNSWKRTSDELLPNRTGIAIRNRFRQIQKEGEKSNERRFDFFNLNFGELNQDFLDILRKEGFIISKE